MSKEAMRLSLDEMKIGNYNSAAERLEAALAKQEQGEPVAWMKEGWGPDCGPYIEFYRDDEMGWRDRKEWTPLYTTPQPVGFAVMQKPWVGLTDEQIGDIASLYYPRWQGHEGFARAIEAKLKEKNT